MQQTQINLDNSVNQLFLYSNKGKPLSDKAVKKRVTGWLNLLCELTDQEWLDDVAEDWEQKLESHGLYSPAISFEGLDCKPEGSASIRSASICLATLIKSAGLEAQYSHELALAQKGTLKASIAVLNHQSFDEHSTTVQILNESEQSILDSTFELEIELKKLLRSFNRDIFKDLKSKFELVTSTDFMESFINDNGLTKSELESYIK
ncbi:hypothetical protein [Vibrio coralliilyticus]|uniref:hypothetical protein n=1 Tax=Vibrio coralliilyticus TaxID=190893 RepID=UPI000BAC1C31|nr:hypothetical protein [Vibrio coralliilyticus]PAW00735.1 hypothetical protein CKJ79_25120 [Vibrio coralliilyticus]